MRKSPKMDACVRPPTSNVKRCFGKIKYMTSTTTCSRSSYSQITFSYMTYGGVNLTIQRGGGGGRQRFQSCGMLKCLVLYRVFLLLSNAPPHTLSKLGVLPPRTQERLSRDKDVQQQVQTCQECPHRFRASKGSTLIQLIPRWFYIKFIELYIKKFSTHTFNFDTIHDLTDSSTSFLMA